jgi:NitT/TauT family transport system substrate-binding protein
MSIGFVGNSRRRFAALAMASLALVAAACGGDDDSASPAATTGTPAATGASAAPAGGATTLRLGYFPNVTHAPAIIGVESGLFTKALGSDVKLELQTFNAGTDVITAMFSGALDASFIGPNPAINGYTKSKGDALRIVAGTTSGGASLVVRSGIAAPADLKGKKLSTPSLGNTQDVALRTWLASQGLKTDTSGGGDVNITPQENADTLTAFQSGAIDGAWVPEPWATRLVDEAGGHVLVDEADLWPDGKFVTTQLIVSKEFLEAHPDAVEHLISGLADAIDEANADPAKAQATVNDGLEKLTNKRLKDTVLAAAWKHLTFTLDPIASSLQTSAQHAEAVGLLDTVDLTKPGIYDLALLNKVLKAKGQSEVSGL